MSSNLPRTATSSQTSETIVEQWPAPPASVEPPAVPVQHPDGGAPTAGDGSGTELLPSKRDVDEYATLTEVRQLLEDSEPVRSRGGDQQWLLIIDHQEARIFRSLAVGTVPEEVVPEDAADFDAPRSSEDLSSVADDSDPISFFVPLAEALKPAGELLIFGTGTGASSEMEKFTAWLRGNRPDIAARLVGAVAVEQHHLSVEQLLAKARKLFAGE